MYKLKRNMGTIDRTMRILVGSSLFVIGPLTDLVPTDGYSNIILGCMAVVAITSATFSYCALYELTGFNTRAKPE